MAWFARSAFCLVVCLIGVAAAAGREPPADPKPKVEFHWLADKPIRGVTQEKGIPNTCAGDVSYLYKTPILTSGDVAKARVSKFNFGSLGAGDGHFMIYFELTAEAKQKLMADCGERETGMLAVVIDGRIWGAAYFRKCSPSGFVPFAGFFESRAEVDRIVGAVK